MLAFLLDQEPQLKRQRAQAAENAFHRFLVEIGMTHATILFTRCRHPWARLAKAAEANARGSYCGFQNAALAACLGTTLERTLTFEICVDGYC